MAPDPPYSRGIPSGYTFNVKILKQSVSITTLVKSVQFSFFFPFSQTYQLQMPWILVYAQINNALHRALGVQMPFALCS
ncbi:unnamed protein product [Fusarium graminearum]|uniref:Uncharacterized protein n=1 Tax=Gibberella zeae TaxID=5518 RepID=A0A4E9EI39_GIBZA|nr:unnamed protein product [Fusarium graminearum]CAG1972740.1 unnamed protein product [Fusarium graminearum]